MKMQEISDKKNLVLDAILDPNGQCVRIVDREGKSLTFITAKEITIEERPDFSGQIMDKM